MHAQGEYVITTVQELSRLTRLTKLRVDTTDYQTANGSLQGLSALNLLRDLEVSALQPATDTRLATVLPLSYCTALTRLGNLYVPTEVRTRRCIGASVFVIAGVRPARCCAVSLTGTSDACRLHGDFENWTRCAPAGTAAEHQADVQVAVAGAAAGCPEVSRPSSISGSISAVAPDAAAAAADLQTV